MDETRPCSSDRGGLESRQVEKSSVKDKTYPRLSVFFTTRVDGVLEIWDFLYRQKGPILPVKVADYPLLSMKVTTQISFWMEEQFLSLDFSD